jgi:hypothetical protein
LILGWDWIVIGFRFWDIEMIFFFGFFMRLMFLMLMVIMVGACSEYPGTVDNLKVARGLYVLRNIHVDSKYNHAYTVNYQHEGLVIPICSMVTIISHSPKAVRFIVEGDDKEYVYLYHKVVREPLDEHMKKVFGRKCPAKEIRSLSVVDKNGIRKGKAFVGMTKRGVILAIGHPPTHVNGELEKSDEWVYWKDRWNKFSVIFDKKGKVRWINVKPRL